MADNSLIQIFSFLFIVELIGISAFPLTVKMFPWSFGHSFAISRVFGQVILGAVLWSLVSLGVPGSGASSVILSLLLIFLFGSIFNRNWINYLRQENACLSCAYYLVFLFFLSCRYFHPEIHWGEKPMDFTFLNYFFRLESLPPVEPWASGLTMHYYYGGYFLYSAILKLAHVSPDIGYNLIVSLIPALYLLGLYCVFRVYSLSARFSLFSACLLVFASDPEMLISVIRGMRIDSHLFWASTRVYTSPAFTEYPFWTFIFADLHPHFMALPFVVFFLLLLSDFSRNGFGLPQKILVAICLAFILLVNAWDGITSAMLLAFFWVASELLYKPSIKFIFDSVLFSLILCVFCLPVAFSINTPSNEMNLIWTTTDEFNSLANIFRVLGFWLLSLFLCLYFSISDRINFKTFLLNSVVGAGLCVLIGISQFYHHNSLPWSLLCFFYLLLVGYGFSKFSSQITWPQISILAAFSFGFFIVVELIVLIDRMNSVFKFHYFLWTCFGIQALVLIYFSSQTSRRFSLSLLVPICVVSILGSFASLWLVCSQGFHWNLTGVKKGLNGFKYYNDYNYRDAEIISWLRKNAESDSVIVEAHGPSYQDFSRISTNTGLATVLGWDFHVRQRGVSQAEISKRQDAIKTIYQSRNLHLVCRLLKQYQVNYLVLGDLERETYKIANPSELETAPCLDVQFKFGSSYVANVL